MSYPLPLSSAPYQNVSASKPHLIGKSNASKAISFFLKFISNNSGFASFKFFLESFLILLLMPLSFNFLFFLLSLLPNLPSFTKTSSSGSITVGVSLPFCTTKNLFCGFLPTGATTFPKDLFVLSKTSLPESLSVISFAFTVPPDCIVGEFPV